MIDVIGYEGIYRINSDLDIYSVKEGRVLTPVMRGGHPYIHLHRHGERKVVKQSEIVLSSMNLTDISVLKAILVKFL